MSDHEDRELLINDLANDVSTQTNCFVQSKTYFYLSTT